jgi:hypothetical protein
MSATYETVVDAYWCLLNQKLDEILAKYDTSYQQIFQRLNKMRLLCILMTKLLVLGWVRRKVRITTTLKGVMS